MQSVRGWDDHSSLLWLSSLTKHFTGVEQTFLMASLAYSSILLKTRVKQEWKVPFSGMMPVQKNCKFFVTQFSDYERTFVLLFKSIASINVKEHCDSVGGDFLKISLQYGTNIKKHKFICLMTVTLFNVSDTMSLYLDLLQCSAVAMTF